MSNSVQLSWWPLDGVSGGFLFDKAGAGRSAPFHYAEDNCSPFCAQALLQFRRALELISLDWPNSNFVRQLFCRPPSQNATQLLTNALQDLNNRKVIQTAGTCRLSMSHDLSVWLKVGEINKTYFCHQFAHYVLHRLQKLRLIQT